MLGRPVAVFSRYRDEDGADVITATRQDLDISGNVREVVDARGNVAERREYGMLGQVLRTVSVDAGESRGLADVVGAPLRTLDARGNIFYVVYDALRRPIEEWVSPGGKGKMLLTKRVFGDGENDRKAGGERQRGRLVRVYDGGGETRIDAYDLDGQPKKVTRRLVDLELMIRRAEQDKVQPRARVDWSALGEIVTLADLDAVLDVVHVLEEKSYETTARYDARGRVVQTRLPMSGSIHRTQYTEDGSLRRIDRETAAGTHERVYEAEDFDHLGRPTAVRQGESAARTSFTYDPVTERLLRLQSQGGGRSLQDLQYSYDPVGNITQVRDAAQATVFRDNAALEAVNDYRYDALYRLVEATGREHEGQAANGRTPRTSDAVVVPLRATSPNDPKAMRRYTQRYRYDAVGNLVTMQHQAGAGSFRREYAYAEHGNRLRATGNAAEALHERYAYDVAGHMVAMPHLQLMRWNELDELEFVQRGTQRIWLQYAGGQRVRKLVRSGEGVVEDRKYLGGEELYEKRRGGATIEKTLTEHVGGGLQVDIKLIAEGKTIAKPVALRRYALADHLGSVKLEVDHEGQVIAYEEFHPYGTTSYRAMASGLDAAANRYRYTGMERDEETGLAQHGARYYAGWLGRWTSADPIGLGDGVNRYAYCRGRPVSARDRDGHRTEDIPLITVVGSEDQIAELQSDGSFAFREKTFAEVAAEVKERYQEAQRENNEELAWQWTVDIAIAQYIENQEKRQPAGIEELYPEFRGYFTEQHEQASAIYFNRENDRLDREIAALVMPAFGALALVESVGASILNLPRNLDLVPQYAIRGEYGAAAVHALEVAFAVANIYGIGAMRPKPRVPFAPVEWGASEVLTAAPSSLRRTHPIGGTSSSRQVLRMAEEMRDSGYHGPPIDVVVKDGEMFVVDGHHRLKAAKMAGLDSVPISIVDDIAAHPSSWRTVDEVVQDAAEVGRDNLRNKGRRF